MKAEEHPHHCPVCARTYIPVREAMRVPGTGPLLQRLDDEVCIKGGDGWMRVYTHMDTDTDEDQ